MGNCYKFLGSLGSGKEVGSAPTLGHAGLCFLSSSWQHRACHPGGKSPACALCGARPALWLLTASQTLCLLPVRLLALSRARPPMAPAERESLSPLFLLHTASCKASVAEERTGEGAARAPASPPCSSSGAGRAPRGAGARGHAPPHSCSRPPLLWSAFFGSRFSTAASGAPPGVGGSRGPASAPFPPRPRGRRAGALGAPRADRRPRRPTDA